jgi:hypothetical protein
MSLRRQLAAHGFESNDDYDFALRCLFESEQAAVRTLHVDGRAGRRKTAFANALAHALEYPHILYHDFLRSEPAPAPAPIAPADDDGAGAPELPVPAFDRIVTEACAFSEAARTILILDQLQAADFADQLRLYSFTSTREWSGPTGTVSANPRNLLLVLLSEEPLYHSLAKASFRIWTDIGRAFLDYRPEDYGLGRDALPRFHALAMLFEVLQASPTPSEYGRLLADLLARVRSEDQLRQSIFGWTEGMDRERLFSAEAIAPLREVMRTLEAYLGVDHIEM